MCCVEVPPERGCGGRRGGAGRALTDSGALMNTLLLPSWNWSLSMLTDCSRWRTPCLSSPRQDGQVALVRMAYLWGQVAEKGLGLSLPRAPGTAGVLAVHSVHRLRDGFQDCSNPLSLGRPSRSCLPLPPEPTVSMLTPW